MVSNLAKRRPKQRPVKDHSFSLDKLTTFSNSDPYFFIPRHCLGLFEELVRQEKRLRFPALSNDVGSLLAFLTGLNRTKRVFEMGSGYGHSAFWYFIGAGAGLEKVVLTEKRKDLLPVFNALPWPVNWKNRMDYWQGDAFEKLERESGPFDLFLVDGVKADYKKFVELALPKLSRNGLIAIDNSYWRGSFLDPETRAKKASAEKVHELHQWIGKHQEIEAVFIPFLDGLTLVRKRS